METSRLSHATPNVNSKTQAVIDRRNAHMCINYGRYPIVMDRGEGRRLWDTEGKAYLDLFSGFGAGLLGHCHPDLVKAVTDQAGKLWHVGNLFHTEPQTLAAEAIAKHGFGGRSYFCHAGADANDSAFKLARLYGQAKPGKAGHRYKVITANNSFHGRSFGGMVATGQPKVRHLFEPHLPGFSNVAFNSIDAIKGNLDDQTVAVMVEPIQGEGGVNVPDADYLPNLRALCDEHDLLLICDEVWTGCGRTGKYFAHQHWNITPDIMTLAKGVGGGLPVGVMCARDEVAAEFNWEKHGGVVHASTLGGNPIAMAATAAVFHVLERDNLVKHGGEMGDYAMQRLREAAKTNDAIVNVRGKGLFVGIELDPAKGWFASAKDVANRCMDRGVLINATQTAVLRLAPAVTVTKDELDEGLAVVEAVLAGQ